ncbi:hypothetical protein FISHEDRAFT_56235 [Fistulina hepatica ATCC 64428]|uniref:Uncharacterized protein n=1 Tax=Fistulina hepatica ATCC 64428 TaxID=1128425 RepID=A0A0D7AK77_9AGAR|nr:hypothetical protein FISHEDRAFT_56235 [Fistulina hepatica ATCC 64428]
MAEKNRDQPRSRSMRGQWHARSGKVKQHTRTVSRKIKRARSPHEIKLWLYTVENADEDANLDEDTTVEEDDDIDEGEEDADESVDGQLESMDDREDDAGEEDLGEDGDDDD